MADSRSHIEQKLQALIRQIEELNSSEFPHEDGRDALDLIRKCIKIDIDRGKKIPAGASAALLNGYYSQANLNTLRLLPVLGFILRSTNVRNSFEFFDPLKRLALALVGPKAKLILSSEWEFSPMTYPMSIQQLPDFILIGLPASESENALVIPLAGHELGHTVWISENITGQSSGIFWDQIRIAFLDNWARYERVFGGADKTKIDSDLQIRANVTVAYKSLENQATEIFCDAIGVAIFGESFAQAFKYLLAPGFPTLRSDRYPTLKKRVEYMQLAATHFKAPFAVQYVDDFVNERDIPEEKSAFIIEMADIALTKCVHGIIQKASNVMNKAAIRGPDKKSVESITNAFKLGIPADGKYELADIIEAGWAIQNNASWMNGEPEIERISMLNELIFKSIEVAEFYKRTANA